MKAYRLSLVLLSMAALSACQEQAVEPEPIRPAQVWQIKTQLSEQVDTYSGEIAPRQEVNLSFRVAGKIIARHVEVGNEVEVGQAIASLDNEDAKLAVTQSEAGLQTSQLSLQAARDNYLAAQGSLSAAQNNLLAAQGALTSARGNLAATQAGLEAAQSAVDSAQATAASAQASVGVAEAELKNAQIEYQRTVQLVQKGYASQTLLDRDNQRLQTAQANVKAAKANAAAAQSQVAAARARVKTSQAQVQAAAGEVESAQANLGVLQGQVKASQAQAQAAQTQIGVAESQIDNTRAQVDLVKNQSNYTQLASTVAGVVTRTYVEAGQVVAAGQTVASIAKAGEWDVQVRVGEQAIQQIKTDQVVAVSLWADQDQSLQGKVREISPAADASRTWLVKIGLDSPAGLKLGMTATVAFKQPLDKAVAWLPATALYQYQAKPAIWVLDANNKVQVQPITVERYLQDGLLVSGLEAGLKVVAAGVNRLYAEQTVLPVPYNGQAQPVQ